MSIASIGSGTSLQYTPIQKTAAAPKPPVSSPMTPKDADGDTDGDTDAGDAKGLDIKG
ncbi:MAG TPA: hypothetical protein VGI81_19160 [Tepidisphaeraceae bacterium]|jgi:hypothetical protein